MFDFLETIFGDNIKVSEFDCPAKTPFYPPCKISSNQNTALHGGAFES